MKILYSLFCLLILSSQSCFAQKVRYTDTTNVWTLTWDYWGDSSGPSVWDKKYIGDTIHNGIQYYIQEYGIVPFFWVREDTAAGKVFYLESVDSVEKVLFDYTLAIGDTFISNNPYYTYSQPHRFILSSIDTLFINNVPHMIQHFDYIGSSYVMQDHTLAIEGLGCLEGGRMLIPPHPNPGSMITCFQNQGVHPIITPGWPPFFDNIGSCEPLKISEKIHRNILPTVVPNPATDLVSIVWNRSISTGHLMITDIVGKVVAEIGLVNKDKAALSVSDFPPSMYFYRIIDHDGTALYSGKFIVE
ncbi:MAG TPA: T9SS type A sorting domain-containing protein [Flavipsychrobacter sp.]|nr:T9SS type A sorting domain-containing protein [Flavipsychrobacter sp.]